MTPEWRRRLTRSQRRMLKLAGRRLLASPWFAAGAGFVIATAAIIYSPHPQLFAPAIQVTHCKSASCNHQQPLTPLGGLPAKPAGVGAVPVPTLPPGTTFLYQPVGQSNRHVFGMWIAIRMPRSVSQWQLSLVIPSGTSLYVYYWPRWKTSGSSLTVNSLIASTESAGYAQISAHENGGEDGSSRSSYTVVLFQVRGTGTLSNPSNCIFNGASCTFKQSHDLASTAQPGTETGAMF